MKLSKEMKYKMAIKMVLLDAIEKGHVNANELTAYMQSETFKTAVNSYVTIIENNS